MYDNFQNNPNTHPTSYGLNSYVSKVYTFTGIGVLITGIIAVLTYYASVQQTSGEVVFTAFGEYLYNTPLIWVFLFAPLGLILLLFIESLTLKMMSSFTFAFSYFCLFVTLMGVSQSMIFLMYTETSIAYVFFVAAMMFGALSLYGLTTKHDLSGAGKFLFMCLCGLIIATLVNIYLNNSVLEMFISYAGVLVFAGLTAYDSQQLKSQYQDIGDNSAQENNFAVLSSLLMYLNFINLFSFLLSILGEEE